MALKANERIARLYRLWLEGKGEQVYDKYLQGLKREAAKTMDVAVRREPSGLTVFGPVLMPGSGNPYTEIFEKLEADLRRYGLARALSALVASFRGVRERDLHNLHLKPSP